jgi:hypothetical protein
VSVPLWCERLAARFWAAAGDPPPLPRDLQFAALALPLNTIELDGVSVESIRRWFARLNLPIPLAEPDRPLRACLVAWRGEGFAFLDSNDDEAERRFSLAHELAHFLRDYLDPREAVAACLGSAALEVLDGLRPPTADERLHAVLRGVAVGPFAHLLRRDDGGRPLTPAERDAESAADRLAFELLAPAAEVGAAANRVELASRLAGEFGLPPLQAAAYAAILRPPPAPVDRAVSRLLRRSKSE